MKKALYFEKIENKKVHCCLCPHNCIIKPAGLGICRARKNVDGELYSLNYARIASLGLDHIEKKPLFRFQSGSMILSAGTFGCNLKCPFCQNWSIAHMDADTVEMKPEELVERAMETKKAGNIGIAYTYNEPSIWYEYVYDCAVQASKEGLSNVLVTNGFIEEEPLRELLPYIDAMNIDVKAYTSEFYREICKAAALEHVKRTVELAVSKCHVEVTTLVIPDLNDSEEEITELAAWLASISTDIPLHLNRFFPNYRMTNRPPTPVSVLERAKKRASRYLEYVYIGNV